MDVGIKGAGLIGFKAVAPALIVTQTKEWEVKLQSYLLREEHMMTPTKPGRGDIDSPQKGTPMTTNTDLPSESLA